MSKRNVYKGHRYVPKIMGEWNQEETYEGLSIVTNKGTSYTSKKRVPVGIDILDEEYWVVTGNYNAQVETYRQEVRELDGRISETETGVENNTTQLAQIKLQPTTEDSTVLIQNLMDNENNTTVELGSGHFKISSQLTLNRNLKIKGSGKNETYLDFYDTNGFNSNGYSLELEDVTLRTNGSTYTAITLNGEYNLIQSVGFEGITKHLNYWRFCFENTNVWYSHFSRLSVTGGNVDDVFLGTVFKSSHCVNNTYDNLDGIYLDTVFEYTEIPSAKGNYNEGNKVVNSSFAAINVGVTATYGNLYTFIGVMFDMYRKTGIYLHGKNVGNLIVQGCWFAGMINSPYTNIIGIETQNSNKSLISNNNFTNGNHAILNRGAFAAISSNSIADVRIGIQVSEGNNNSISNNSFANVIDYDILCETNESSITGHSKDTKIKWTNKETTTVSDNVNTKVMYSEIVTLDGGTKSETVTIPIKPNKRIFSKKPLANIVINGDLPYMVNYLYDSPGTTKESLSFKVFTLDDSFIPTDVPIRLTIILSEDDTDIISV